MKKCEHEIWIEDSEVQELERLFKLLLMKLKGEKYENNIQTVNDSNYRRNRN
jgi:hypothetical protein